MQTIASSLRVPMGEQSTGPTGYWFGVSLLQNMLDRFDYPVFLLDAQGGLLFQNQRARDLLVANDGLALTENRLLPALRLDQIAWAEGLRDALAGQQPMLRLHDCPQTTFVLMPISEVPGVRVRMVMVAASKLQQCDSQSVVGFGRLYGLTRTETQILHLLVNGATAHEISMQRGVAIATVRTHIKNLLTKTGHPGLRQLQAALSQLPAVHSLAQATQQPITQYRARSRPALHAGMAAACG
jgi:DNA-binding CsgD family transcriptional regulator